MAAIANLTKSLEDSLTKVLNSWSRNQTHAAKALDKILAEENFDNVIWYLMVMIGMFAFIIVAILVSTVKSKRREHSDDPYHKYIEEDWTAKVKSQILIIDNYVHKNPNAKSYEESYSH
ncbi:potassium voltage-gated channel subfamily E member 2 [Lepisosteus oculatus]|nr:PREDICTED: potassium voltage-gated channel subfamily E member 2 [Lepisosteus oculatus]XP_015219204.1 PREDICTED: potassium voltage-gated channel subfamily E member 2 [Lepisosteus oculatus]XP_015219206.1 PREDICTED: potassium voltage-gated channel subfamily E member 2 [Lepisosteus oculatus]